jgi:2-polyprenyl-3-methyl-5-hydroxy-6-metoxy-1,4-benzoquinol methylase
MLACHLDQDTRLASRPIAIIEEIVDWLDRELNVEGKRVCDLGCGPGLYLLRLAQRGGDVIGVDFSTAAIAHAESGVSQSESQPEKRVAYCLTTGCPAISTS